MLKEPQERVRELRDDEAMRLDAVMRDDYAPFFTFLAAAGVRRNEALTLKWSEVDFAGERIVKPGKGDKRIVIPITTTVRDILFPLQGHDSVFVFTYVAERTQKERRRGDEVIQPATVAGRRYPLTVEGVKTRWRRLRKAAGVEGFRLHDYRHDFGTKLLRETGNLKLVSKALNHARIETTMRYAHVADSEVAAAIEAMQRRSKGPTEKSHQTPLSIVKAKD
jgi:integrase